MTRLPSQLNRTAVAEAISFVPRMIASGFAPAEKMGANWSSGIAGSFGWTDFSKHRATPGMIVVYM